VPLTGPAISGWDKAAFRPPAHHIVECLQTRTQRRGPAATRGALQCRVAHTVTRVATDVPSRCRATIARVFANGPQYGGPALAMPRLSHPTIYQDRGAFRASSRFPRLKATAPIGARQSWTVPNGVTDLKKATGMSALQAFCVRLRIASRACARLRREKRGPGVAGRGAGAEQRLEVGAQGLGIRDSVANGGARLTPKGWHSACHRRESVASRWNWVAVLRF
jgi:hypothetical protein